VDVLPAVQGETGHGRGTTACAIVVVSLLNTVAKCIVLEIRLAINGASVGLAAPGPEELIALVVAVGPRLVRWAFRLLGEVAFVVIGVGPGAVAGEAVAGAGSVVAIVAVAVGVVGEGGGAVGGELVGVVVGVGDRGAVALDLREPAVGIVGVGVVGDVREAVGLAVVQVCEPAGAIVGVARVRDRRDAAETVEPLQRVGLAVGPSGYTTV
jgi:hypothetical protein